MLRDSPSQYPDTSTSITSYAQEPQEAFLPRAAKNGLQFKIETLSSKLDLSRRDRANLLTSIWDDHAREIQGSAALQLLSLFSSLCTRNMPFSDPILRPVSQLASLIAHEARFNTFEEFSKVAADVYSIPPQCTLQLRSYMKDRLHNYIPSLSLTDACHSVRLSISGDICDGSTLSRLRDRIVETLQTEELEITSLHDVVEQLHNPNFCTETFLAAIDDSVHKITQSASKPDALMLCDKFSYLYNRSIGPIPRKITEAFATRAETFLDEMNMQNYIDVLGALIRVSSKGHKAASAIATRLEGSQRKYRLSDLVVVCDLLARNNADARGLVIDTAEHAARCIEGFAKDPRAELHPWRAIRLLSACAHYMVNNREWENFVGSSLASWGTEMWTRDTIEALHSLAILNMPLCAKTWGDTKGFLESAGMSDFEATRLYQFAVVTGVKNELSPEHIRQAEERFAVVERRGEPSSSLFERDVHLFLRTMGFDPKPQVFCMGAWIDLVIERDGRKIAIECDGERFHHVGGHAGGVLCGGGQFRSRLLEANGFEVLHVPLEEWNHSTHKAELFTKVQGDA